ncbi:MAG: gamma-butyrobetaine hydroxylase-like domain-containing protein, partial [Bacteroidota bacterium]
MVEFGNYSNYYIFKCNTTMSLTNKPDRPKSITRPRPDRLKVVWPDGYEAIISLENLRRECPCAECRSKQLNGKKKPDIPMLRTFHEGMNELCELGIKGNYAINAIWADGHDTGYYTWADLRAICEK